MTPEEDEMDDFGYLVLVLFIVFRILIAAGLFYLIVIEIRRYKKRKPKEDEGANENATGEDVDRSDRSRE